ncbi:hypothetical protein DSECCO2_603950 [anaerobic digester metagenome]
MGALERGADRKADQLDRLRVKPGGLDHGALVEQVRYQDLGPLRHTLEYKGDPAVLVLDLPEELACDSIRSPLCNPRQYPLKIHRYTNILVSEKGLIRINM